MRKVAELGPDGKRVYRKRYKQVRKPRSEWVAVPIPDAGIPRAWVDAAREAIKDNKRPSNSGRRFWPLSGGVLRCPACGCAMSPHTISPGGKSTRFYYYYRCAKHMKDAYDGCSNYRHYRAQELEEEVWQEIRGLLRDPDRLRAGMDAAIEMHRFAGRPRTRSKGVARQDHRGGPQACEVSGDGGRGAHQPRRAARKAGGPGRHPRHRRTGARGGPGPN